MSTIQRLHNSILDLLAAKPTWGRNDLRLEIAILVAKSVPETEVYIDQLFNKLEAKTNWGRNELKGILDQVNLNTRGESPDCFDPNDPMNFESHWSKA